MATKVKYLIPTDFSAPARLAVTEAVRVAQRDDAELVLLHVIEETDYSVGNIIKHEGFPNLEDQIRKGAERHLRDLQAELIADQVPSITMIRTGKPSVAIADIADEINADMIIISSRGLSGLRRFFLGSTIERLVRIAKCQVLVLREGDTETESCG